MQTITVEIKNSNALKTIEALADKHFVTIVDKTDINSPSLPGKPLKLAEFTNWIHSAENEPTVSLNEAKAKWEKKKKLLRRNMR